MNDERLAELKEKYKDRNLFEELEWGAYVNHSGYTSKQNGEFLNWLCMAAYKALKERPQGEWIDTGHKEEYWAEEYQCSICGAKDHWHNYCPNCGAEMRKETDND